MESNPLIEFVHGAYQELRRLELLLQENPVYRRVEALRRLIGEYEAQMASLGPPDVRPGPNSLTTSVPEAPHHPIAPATVSSPLIRPDLIGNTLKPGLSPDQVVSAKIESSVQATPPTARRHGGPRERSQAAQIRDAAVPFLEQKGEPASGTEIYKAIRETGVEVRGKKPSAVVCNALRWDPVTFRITPKGFGLTAWFNDSDTL